VQDLLIPTFFIFLFSVTRAILFGILISAVFIIFITLRTLCFLFIFCHFLMLFLGLILISCRQAQELTERTSADQAAAIKEPLSVVNRRWDELLRGMVERQRQLENALLRLGQFQHALAELIVWIDKTDGTLDELKPVAGDPQVLEVELAKLKVIILFVF
jgi:hypothetical protein